MTDKPEALRLADRLESDFIRSQTMVDAAAELRRLHAVNADLLEALKVSRAQWIHSVNAQQCLDAISRAEGSQP